MVWKYWPVATQVNRNIHFPKSKKLFYTISGNLWKMWCPVRKRYISLLVNIHTFNDKLFVFSNIHATCSYWTSLRKSLMTVLSFLQGGQPGHPGPPAVLMEVDLEWPVGKDPRGELDPAFSQGMERKVQGDCHFRSGRGRQLGGLIMSYGAVNGTI